MSAFGLQDVEEFIYNNDIGFDAAEELRTCALDIQEKVCTAGAISDGDPSSVLLQRIREAQPLGEAPMEKDPQHRGDNWSPSRSRRQSPPAPRRGGSESPRDNTADSMENQFTGADLEDFIEAHRLDERAANDLRSESVEVQVRVMERGIPSDARNPSAMLLSRIKESRQDVQKGSRSGNSERTRDDRGWGEKDQWRESSSWSAGYESNGHRSESAPSTAEIESFLRLHDVDERAANDFRACPPEVQARVLARGEMKNARNPSAALIARIKQSREGPGPSGSRSDSWSRPDGQDVSNARHGNGGRDDWSRREPQQDWNERHRGPPPGPSQREVDDFIAANRIDERAALDLIHCPPAVQARVLGRGDLMDARNPSAMMLSRIRDARKDVEKEGAWPDSHGQDRDRAAWGHGNERGRPSRDRDDSRSRFGRDRDEDRGRSRDHGRGRRGARDHGSDNFSHYGGSMSSGHFPPSNRDMESAGFGHQSRDSDRYRSRPMLPTEAEIIDFIRSNRIDDRAATDLLNCQPEVQARVLARGDLRDARNPSAMMLVRLGESKQDVARDGRGRVDVEARRPDDRGGRGSRSSAPDVHRDVLDFLDANRIDDRAAQDLLSCPPEVQARVLERGDLRNVRNPSAMLLVRIKESKQDVSKDGRAHTEFDSRHSNDRPGRDSGRSRSPPPIPPAPGPREDVFDFIEANRIDNRAAQDLLSCPPEVQARVLARGDLRNARNPSAMLLVRIKESREDMERDGRDHADFEARRFDDRAAHDRHRLPDAAREDEIMDFIDINRIDERAAEDLRACPPELQARVLARGNFTDARNPSALLLSRIRELRKDIERDGYSSRGGAREDNSRPGRGEPLPSATDIDRFLEANGIDERAGDDLRACDPEVQARVLSRGEFRGARNPSAALIARIKESKQERNSSRGNSDGKPYPSSQIDSRVGPSGRPIFGSQAPLPPMEVRPSGRPAFDYSAARSGYAQPTTASGPVPGPSTSAASYARARSRSPPRPSTVAYAVPKGYAAPPRGGSYSAPSREGVEPVAPQDRFAIVPRERAMPSSDEGPLPQTHLLDLPGDSVLIADGLPAEGFAVIHHDAAAELLRNGQYILEDLVGNLDTVKIEDDPDWQRYPDVAQALGQVGSETTCYCVAVAPEFGKWGVGIGAEWETRESAAKLALSLALAPDSDMFDSLLNTYPDLGALCEASGACSAEALPQKKLKNDD